MDFAKIIRIVIALALVAAIIAVFVNVALPFRSAGDVLRVFVSNPWEGLGATRHPYAHPVGFVGLILSGVGGAFEYRELAMWMQRAVLSMVALLIGWRLFVKVFGS